MQLGAQRAGLLRLRRGLLHLTEDLRLADHHRIQRSGDAEEMPRGVLVESADGVRSRDGTQVAENVLGRPLPVGDREDLEPVAGRDEQRLADAGQLAQLLEPLGDLLRRDGELLAHRDRRVLVREADADERHRSAPIASVPWRAGAAVRIPT